MSGYDFGKIVRAWSMITPPLRPNREVVAAIERLTRDCGERAVLLGVTPEFADLATQTFAIDISPAMAKVIWPGDSSSRRVILGDWRRMPFASESFSLCLGDGSFTLMRFPDELAALFAEMARVMRSGAKVVCRVFVCPETGETPAAVRDATMSGQVQSFDTLRWRLAMMLAADRPGFNVPLQDILAAFNSTFPDRNELLRVTGWNREWVEAIDANYTKAKSAFSFASRQSLADVASALFTDVQFVPSGTYELAECCPLMVMQRR